jgi:DMSO/TMAO reductase YedYZ molybdopterin-dependent catalytic subunit
MIPGLYGQKMPKWITRITFAAEDRLGYWEGEARGWSNIASVRTHSAFGGGPRTVKLGSAIRLSGWAFGGNRAIRRVEVNLDRDNPNTWQDAHLTYPPGPLAWTWWAFDWQPSAPGDYRVAVRATDDTGIVQTRAATGMLAGAFPDGVDAIHMITVSVTAG